MIATGFNRNHRANGEGGIIPEEYAVEYVVDRVDTVSTVWLGLTLGCARCHNHKFDPFTQKEFYQMFAYFNQVPERGNAFKYGNSPPFVAAPLPEQEQRQKSLERQLAAAGQQFAALQPRIREAQAAWEASARGSAPVDWAPSRALAVNLPLDGSLDGEITPDPPRSEKYLYLMENGPVLSPIRSRTRQLGKTAKRDSERVRWAAPPNSTEKRYLDLGNVGNFGFYDSFTLSAWIDPSEASGTIVSRAIDEPEGKGFGLFLKDGHLSASLVQRWLDDGVRVESEEVVPVEQWSHVTLTYDGSRLASAACASILNGRPLRTKIDLDYMNQPFDVKQPLRIGGGLGPANRFRGQYRRRTHLSRCPAAEDVAVLAVREPVSSHRRNAGVQPERRLKRESSLVFPGSATRRGDIKQAWQSLTRSARISGTV